MILSHLVMIIVQVNIFYPLKSQSLRKNRITSMEKEAQLEEAQKREIEEKFEVLSLGKGLRDASEYTYTEARYYINVFVKYIGRHLVVRI